LGLQEVEASRISGQSAHEIGKVISPSRLKSKAEILLFIAVAYRTSKNELLTHRPLLKREIQFCTPVQRPDGTQHDRVGAKGKAYRLYLGEFPFLYAGKQGN
jgi:hypothetical protein